MQQSSKTSKSISNSNNTAVKSLVEQAYIAIKQLILTGELSAGEQINVSSLTKKLNIGRSPVHMAIHRLDSEGLVDILPRKGILVREESLNSFFELLNARQLIEPYLTKHAVDNITLESIKKLEELVNKGWEHHENNNKIGSMEIDRLFHQVIYESSGNKILAEFASQLLDRSMTFWFRSPSSESKRPNIVELEDLLDKIKRKDKEGATEFMLKHVSSIKNKFL